MCPGSAARSPQLRKKATLHPIEAESTAYFKYLDGVEQECWWYHGRCLSYGEGVA